ncbi:MAG: ABC transporter substrate-binding protein, partial [Desulfobacteraceae bacterium]|nr:ABC transporter substrate-binding protein [Desulfobacteraceae bacterium]
VAAAIKLIAVDGTKVIIGGVASSVTLAIEPIATSKGVILFSPASSSPRLTGISKYFFRTWPSDVFEATAIAEFSYRTLRLRRVAVLYVNNDYGLGLKDEFTKRFKACGGQVVEIQTHEQGTNDLRTQLTKIKSASPDGVYLAGYHREMAFATKQMRELGVTAQILGDADYGVQELLDIAGNSAEGAIYSTPEYNINTGTDSVRAFADAFKRKYGRESSVFEANAYDAVMIVSKAIEKHGLDTEQIADFIASVENYAGASGDISFGAKGEVEKPASIKIVKGGAFHLY